MTRGAVRRGSAIAAVGIAGVLVLGLPLEATSADGPADRLVRIDVGGGTAIIDPATLEVVFEDGGEGSVAAEVVWSGPSPTDLGTPKNPVVDGDVTSWNYVDSDLRVEVSERDGRLDVRMTSPTKREVVWPVAATDPLTRSIEFPNGEGQSIPVDDAFWWSEDAHLTDDGWNLTDNLTMPFWGTTLDGQGVSYVVHDDTDIGTELAFEARDDRLRVSARHAFDSARATSSYEVTIAGTDGNPVAAAQDYRSVLLAENAIVPLEEKIAGNPDAADLIGAFHGYLWGDGDDPELLRRLRDLGIDRAWLGFDVDVAQMSTETVAAAASAGFLVGPYDTWENAQDPEDSDSSSSVWPGDIWPSACALDEHGDPLEGFGGRGCTLSSTAMAEEERQRGVLSDRVGRLIANGVTSYFLDVDATGDLAHDFSPDHPQTEAQDRRNRIDRLGRLSSGEFSSGTPLVLGSEKAEWWANPVLSFSHGSSTPISNGVWMLQKDKEEWGGYWPEERPGFFFKPVELSDALRKEMFDPRYRVPLYETVLHDSVVSTDRWEMGLYKFTGIEQERILTNLLYNTPAMVSLDHQVLDEHGKELAAMQAFFRFLQDAAGTDPLLSFERLGDSVQRTVFGTSGDVSLTVTANFGSTAQHGVPAGCVTADIESEDPLSYCP